MLKINKKFAKKYEEYRRKEELQKFKDKYGDVNLSEARKKSADSAAQAAAAANSDEDGSDGSTSSESEDEDCEGWTPQTEAGFLRVYAALQSGDSRLYDPSVSWFKEEEEEQEGGEGSEAGTRSGETAAADGAEYKPMFYNEYHRNYLLKGAYAQDDETTAESRAMETSEATQRNLQEAERIRRTLAESHANEPDSGESSDGEHALLVKKTRRRHRQANGGEGEGEAADPMERLHKFVSDRGDDGEDLELEAEFREDLAKLKRRWTGSEGRLTEAERYLRDYITKEFWRQRPQPANGEGEDQRLSDDEAFLSRQSEFEAKWNGRSEAAERDAEFEAAFRRTVASGENLEDADSEDDGELFVAKATDTATETPADAGDDCEEAEEVEADLRRLERRRQWRIDGDDGEEGDDNDGDVATEGAKRPEIRAYPRRIADSLRQSTSDTARAQRRAERRERRRGEKLSRRRDLARLVALKEAEVASRLERLRRNAGVPESASDALADAVGGDFLDAEFDPAEHDRRMARLFGEDFYGEGQGEARARAKRPVFSDDEELAVDVEAEAEAEAERLRAEVDRMHAEDLIRAGPGQADLRCRFNYRQVEPNDFGLSAAEVLLADDRELNAWCTLRKASQYRERDADRRDRRRFHSARCQAKKESLMPGLMKRLEAAAAYPDAESWAAAVARGRDTAGELGDGPADGAKKRRRKKNNAKQGSDKNPIEPGATKTEDDVRPPRCRKRLKPETETAAASVEEPTQRKQKTPPAPKEKTKSKKKTKTATNPGGGRLKISEQRLLELGIDPRKFHRMRRQQQQQRKKGSAGAGKTEEDVEAD